MTTTGTDTTGRRTVVVGCDGTAEDAALRIAVDNRPAIRSRAR